MTSGDPGDWVLPDAAVDDAGPDDVHQGGVPGGPTPPRTDRRRWVRWLAAAVAVLLIGAVSGLVAVRHDTPRRVTTSVRPPASTTSTTGPPPSPAAQAQLDSLVHQLEGFVERTRGLTFTRPVKVTLLDDAAFRKRLDSGEKADQAEVDKSAKVLRALGLIGKDVDLAASEKALLGGAVAGFYDRKAKELFVRGAQQTPYVREVLVHELTHALQDQHFNIDRTDLDKANDEKAQSFTAVVEGDAVRVQRAYLSQMSPSDRQKANAEESVLAGGVPSSVPEALIEVLQFPYLVGPSFLQAVIGRGGQPGLDATFTKPPTTSEQLITPDKYFASEGERSVPAPKAPRAAIDSGDIGEFGLLLILEKGLAQNTAIRAGQGWGGDSYVAWDEGKQTCVRDRMVMDTDKDRNEALSALRQWASNRSGASIDTSPAGGPAGAFEFTSCG